MPIPLLKGTSRELARAHRSGSAFNWIGLWALVIGAVAIGLALLVYNADGDPVAASFVLIAIAAIIGVVLHESVQTGHSD
jgi:hypothetical protein